MFKEYRLSVMCIQESKLQVMDVFFCKSVCALDHFGFSYRSSIGASGGLLTMWDAQEVEVWVTRSMYHLLIIQGCFLKSGEVFSIANVYAHWDSEGKQLLWDRFGLPEKQFGV